MTTLPATSLSETARRSPERAVETYVEGRPYDLFYLSSAGRRLVGRKTEAAYPGPDLGDGPVERLKGCLVEPGMLLGIVEREQVAEDHVAVFHRPLDEAEKAALFAEAAADPLTDLYYPFAQLGDRVREAAATEEGGWEVTEEFVAELDHAESVLRDYVPQRLAELGFLGGIAYDAACSTGAFLSAVGRRFPDVRTVGQDLSAAMVEHARSRVDEVHCGDSIRPAIPAGSADLVVCRHLNAFVVGTDQAHDLLAAAVSRCRDGGLIVLLGHTPILISTQWCEMAGLEVVQRSAATPSGHALFQCYVLRKGGSRDG
ncbi:MULTISPECIES: class I SAM-dependent methyltransferase [Actinoalloteichus]|uniref:Methyltransferase family protein n=1 Tax=Actinoalloteichus fjordicus TaxID=1612552 RepID=A0AAC9PSN3_9PSEU|nr:MULTISPECIES: class I SAM-dependent methyltransferase [Actinoalloteichus]APU15021.1 methyltransferase family protein [Actinoalloteichus fjordicus]APU21089.1 methyltransferase family protein [Actinoalloteichus sp. GBA129-24]